MRRWLIMLLLVACAVPVGAHAFGTVNVAGQAAEHERITRAALWCRATEHPRACMQNWSIAQLAGQTGSFGAVGAVDTYAAARPETHCDNSDYFAENAHSRAAATAALLACRAYALRNLTLAVTRAKGMLDRRGRLIRDEVEPLGHECSFIPPLPGKAKCNVLQAFGATLHVGEDFYSHTTWADESDPARLHSVENPPGLNNPGLTPLFDPGATPSIPQALTGGCFALVDEENVCRNRVTHDAINKDEGTVDPRTGAATNPKTPRGKIGSNFAKAVSGSIREARRQWGFLQKRLVSTYGKRRGHLMICALTHDHPYEDCQVKLTIEGLQRVTWTLDIDHGPGPCGGHQTGSGSTTMGFDSKHPVYASPVDLVPPEGEPGLFDFLVDEGVTLPTTAHLDSGGSTSVQTDAGECAGGGKGSAPSDCGKKKISLPLRVVSLKEDTLTLRNAKDTADPYKNCPNSGTARTKVGPDDADLTSDDLFDQEIAKLIVKGKRRHRAVQVFTGSPSGTITVTTALDWTLTIEKPPDAQASASRRRRF